MVRGKASDTGKLMIKKAHKHKNDTEKGWAANDKGCDQALMLASEHQFRKSFAKRFRRNADDDNADIPIRFFLEWINENEVFVKKESRNRQGLSSHEIVIEYVNENLINHDLPKISLKAIINNLIYPQKGKVRFYNITNANWRRFLGCEQEIEEDIFAAFWYALGIEEDYNLFFEKIHDSQIEEDKINEIISELKTFNHDSQIRVVKNSINDYTQAFLLVHQCPWRRSWVLNRIESEIQRLIKLKIERETINHRLSVQELKRRFEQNYSTEYLSDKLNRHHLFLVIHIDDYGLERLEYFIQNCWKTILERVDRTQKGKVLLFLVAKGSGNDWQTQWQDSQILQSSLREIPLTLFTPTDLEDLILNIATKFTSQFNHKILQSGDEARFKADTLLTKCICSVPSPNGNTKDIDTHQLLNDIFQIFHCQPKDLIRQWQTYPHR